MLNHEELAHILKLIYFAQMVNHTPEGMAETLTYSLKEYYHCESNKMCSPDRCCKVCGLNPL